MTAPEECLALLRERIAAAKEARKPILEISISFADRLLAALDGVLALHYEDIGYTDDVAEGYDGPVPDDYERHYCVEDGETWPCATVSAITQALEGQV